MPKFRVELELDYNIKVSQKHPDRPKTKSHINAIMRDDVHAQVQNALNAFGFNADVYLVRKVNS